MTLLQLDGGALEYEWICAARIARPLVMLHEGLGSLAMWKDFPRQVAQVTGYSVLTYSRAGYGQSSPATLPRPVSYLNDEALTSLPRLLDALRVERPVLLGHSDGASIALIHAGGSDRGVRGVIAMAPHVFVEDITIAGIAAAREAYASTDLPERLARYHQDAHATFHGWNDIWLDPAFRSWNIEAYLPRIGCPVLAIQGQDDEYATMDQLARISRGAREVEVLKLRNCGHSPHRDQADQVLESVKAFVGRLPP